MGGEEYKHIGIQVTRDIHKKLKTMALDKDTSITNLVSPLIKDLVEKWEKEKGSDGI